MKKQLYNAPSIKSIKLLSCLMTDPGSIHNATWAPDNEPSKRFTGGIEEDDDEGSSSPWSD